ncbi:IucA/IucC family protein [Nguyenibacter vanlangensis]|uniref:IucA/IucC family protein n=1 Tax=Nguyenibacter vanlangensis TaxID=1216886 RepID=A0ABZ3D5T4_9PROT
MKLDAVIQDRQALLSMERYVGLGTKTYSPLAARTEAGPAYQPESGVASFDLVTVTVPRERVSVFQAAPAGHLAEYYLRPDGIRFAIHPATWVMEGVKEGIAHLEDLRALPRGAAIRVAPTASTRTVLTVGPEMAPHFLKLHYPVRISRFNRGLLRRNVQNSVAITAEMAQARSERFAYLPETLGFAFGTDEKAWGFLVREVIARPPIAGRFLIPCFALYGRDIRAPDDPPLLVQMIARLRVDPAAFVVNEIIVPVIAFWCWGARRGLLLESHAQNTLIEIDRDFRPRRIVFRDFDIWIDTETRRRCDLGLPFPGAGLVPDAGQSMEQYYSIVYDRFIGHNFFDYLLDLLRRFYDVEEEVVRQRARAAFHQFFPEAQHFFPKDTVFYFSKDAPPGHEFMIEDLRQPPEWR